MNFSKSKFLLIIIFSFFSFLNIFSANDNFSNTLTQLNIKIDILRTKLVKKNNNLPKNSFKKLIKLHKKRYKLDPYDDEKTLSFISDDLKFGKGRYALHLLLNSLNDNFKLKLLELNLIPDKQNQKIKIKTFTYNPFHSFWLLITHQKNYTFKKDNAVTILNTIDTNNLSPKELIRFNIATDRIKGKKRQKIIPLKRKKVKLQVSKKQKHVKKQKIVSAPKKTKRKKDKTSDIEKPQTNLTPETLKTKPEPAVIPKTAKIVDNRYFWEVVKVINQSKVKRKGFQNWEPIQNKDRLYEGDRLKTETKSSVLLLIKGLKNDDSYTQIFENTEVNVIKLSANNLDELDDVYLDIILGEVLVNIEDLPPVSSFQVKTPTAIAGVRGTRFSVKVLSDMISNILVLHGSVEVSQHTIQGVIKQMVHEGEEIINDRGSDGSKPKIIDEAELKEYMDKAKEIASTILAQINKNSIIQANQKSEKLENSEEEFEDNINDDQNDDSIAANDPDGPDSGEGSFEEISETEQGGSENHSVDPETGQLFDAITGQPILDANGNELFFSPQGPVTADGASADIENPLPIDGGDQHIVDENGQIFDAVTGEPVFDVNGEPIYGSPNGPVTADGEPADYGQPSPPSNDNNPPPNDGPVINVEGDPTNPGSMGYDPLLDPNNYDENGNYIPPDYQAGSNIDLSSPPVSEDLFLDEFEEKWFEGKEVYVPTVFDHKYYVDSLNGNDANDGTLEAPFASLTHAMNEANEFDTSKVILIRLFADSNQTYNVGTGMKVRGSTGIEGFPSGTGNRAKIIGSGATCTGGVLNIANDSFIYLGHLEIINGSPGNRNGIGLSITNNAVIFDNLLITHCVTGLRANGMGSTAIPNTEAYEYDDDKNWEGEKGIMIDNTEFENCDTAVLQDVTLGVVDFRNSKISQCGTAISITTDNTGGNSDYDWILKNTGIFNNTGNGTSIINVPSNNAFLEFIFSKIYSNTSPGGSNIININGTDAALVFEDCKVYNNGSSGAACINFSGTEFSINRSQFTGNSTTASNNIMTCSTSENSIVIGNSLFANNSTTGNIIEIIKSNAGALNVFLSFNTFHNITSSTSSMLHFTNSINLDSYGCSYTSYVDAGTCISGTGISDLGSGSNFNYNYFSNSTPATPGGNLLSTSSATYSNDSDLNATGSGNKIASGTVNSWDDIYSNSNPTSTIHFKPSSSELRDQAGPNNLGYGMDVVRANRKDTGDVDIGCLEVNGTDPLLSGRVYDSRTNGDVEDCIVGLYLDGASSATEMSQGASYSFDVLPGKYFFIVQKEGILFPSQRSKIDTPGAFGETFSVIDGIDQNIDIPVDSLGYLNLTKISNKKNVTAGEILTYGFTVQNAYWFADVKDVKLFDQRKSGFKLVPGSIRINGIKANDPIVNLNNNYVFDIGTVPASTTMKISYQVVVSTGISAGSYQTKAFCEDSNKNTLSNTTSITVGVIPDPLFTNGTVLGRVFMDDNDNGVFDDGENGVPDVVLATEYGVQIKTDKSGLYHLKNIFKGRHTLQVDPATLSLGYVSRNKHGFGFEIFEGSIAKVNIPIIKETADNPRKSFLFVSLGEITLQNNDLSGNVQLVEKDSEFDEDLTVEGRGAFFLKGKILGKYLITASFDSKRLSRNQKYLRKQRLFTNLNPDKYYPVYGDSSAVNYSATETKDALFLLLEWKNLLGKWKTTWGSVDVDWIQYRKVMHGGHISLESSKKTKFNDIKHEAELFYTTSDHQAAHEEFIGTGTSLYHLEHTPIIEGTEQIKVQLKNRFSNSPIYERILIEELDYTINYQTGRILLKRPLTSTITNYNHTIISNDILAGAQGVLVVKYEYENFSVSNRDAFGARINKHFGDHISVDIGYVEEERERKPYKLTTTSTTIKVNEHTSLKVHYNESEESSAGGGISYDGGLTFSSQNANFKDGEKGTSWSVSGDTIINEKISLSASYSETDPGYSTNGTFSSSDVTNYSGNALYLFNELISFGIEIQNSETESNDPTSQNIAVVDHLRKTNLYLDVNNEKWDSRIEYTHQDVGRVFTGTRYLGALPPRGEQLLAMRLGLKPYSRHHYYIIGQTTLKENSRDNLSNDLYSLGLQIPLFEQIDVKLEGRSGDVGDSFITNLIINEDANTQSHIGFETGTNDNIGKFQSVNFSKTYLNDGGAKYKFIKDYSYFNEKTISGDIFDIEIPVNNRWSLGIGYETSNVDTDNSENTISRDVTTMRYNYLNPGKLKLFGKIEWREDFTDESEETTEHIFIQDELQLNFLSRLSFNFRGMLAYADSDSTEDIFNFKQLSAGFAYRPLESDKLNILGKYTYTYDIPLENRIDFIELTTQRKKVSSIDTIFDLNKYVQIVEKVAYRNMSEKVGMRDWIKSDTWLMITGLNIRLYKKWMLGGEYRILNNKEFKDQKSGYMLQIKREMNDIIDLTLGYNFTDFDDDLNNRDDYDRKGAFIRLNSRY